MTRFFFLLLFCLAAHYSTFAQPRSPDTSAKLNLSATVNDGDTQQPMVASVVVEGKLLSSKDNTPLNCQFRVRLNSDFLFFEDEELCAGAYSKNLTSFGWYILEFSSQGFLPVSDTLWVMNSDHRTVQRNYHLNPIEVGSTVRLNNIYFHFGKATLMHESHDALNKVADLFMQNPTLHFEIAGHTDDEGPEQYNLQLSHNRAQAIADYLILKGVDASRLVVHGYGESRPIDSNVTATGKLNNRRVEFTVVANTNQ